MPRLDVRESHEERRRREDDLLSYAFVDVRSYQRQSQLGGSDERRVPEQERFGHRVIFKQLHHRRPSCGARSAAVQIVNRSHAVGYRIQL